MLNPDLKFNLKRHIWCVDWGWGLSKSSSRASLNHYENKQRIKFRSHMIPSNFWALQGCVKLPEWCQICELGLQLRRSCNSKISSIVFNFTFVIFSQFKGNPHESPNKSWTPSKYRLCRPACHFSRSSGLGCWQGRRCLSPSSRPSAHVSPSTPSNWQ